MCLTVIANLMCDLKVVSLKGLVEEGEAAVTRNKLSNFLSVHTI